MNIAGGQGLS